MQFSNPMENPDLLPRNPELQMQASQSESHQTESAIDSTLLFPADSTSRGPDPTYRRHLSRDSPALGNTTQPAMSGNRFTALRENGLAARMSQTPQRAAFAGKPNSLSLSNEVPTWIGCKYLSRNGWLRRS
ncbi:hypothetical protein DENIT_20055 [Pseudomonas veronii]|nr:hypothetical protein DENIT_20055 [Pseudomonas veronii]